MIKKIGFVGSGRVATQLSTALAKAGISIAFVHSKTLENAQGLARQLNCPVLHHLEDAKAVDAIILAVSDDQIEHVSSQLPANIAQIHTSGAVGISEIKSHIKGVMYPFQSINKEGNIDWSKVPFLIESNDPEFQFQVIELVGVLSSSIFTANSEERRYLHLSGVLINNFTNHLAHQSFEILKKINLPERLLFPLIKQTTENILTGEPEKYQTGPASRKDQKTIEAHLELLKSEPQLSKIYRELTESIKGT